MPRKAIGDRPLTTAERQARQRARKADRERELIASLGRIIAARTIREAREIAAATLTGR
jgi:crotonobetainyl-CoA:carnitine CoA-transferase CaiB-like acyl-CoA transferase